MVYLPSGIPNPFTQQTRRFEALGAVAMLVALIELVGSSRRTDKAAGNIAFGDLPLGQAVVAEYKMIEVVLCHVFFTQIHKALDEFRVFEEAVCKNGFHGKTSQSFTTRITSYTPSR